MITLRKKTSGSTLLAFCGESDEVGRAVRITGVEMDTLTVSQVNPAYPDQMPAYGVIVEKLSPTRCLVQRAGDVKLPPGVTLQPGKYCYVASDATLTTTVPVADDSPSGVIVIQVVGLATGPAALNFSPSDTLLEIGA